MFSPTYFGPNYFGPGYFGPASAAASENIDYVDRGRMPISVNQPPRSGSNYPIVDPSDDIALLLADAYLAYDRQAVPYIHPLKITYLYGFGETVNSQPAGTPTPTHDYDIVIKDASNRTVFDSTTVDADYFHTADWDGRLRIIEWTSDEAVCRIIYHTAWGYGDTPIEYNLHIVPESAVLDERVIDSLPRRILSITAEDTTFQGGEVTLQYGYNTTIVAEDFEAVDGGEAGAIITIDGTENSGIGRYPCEEEVLYISTINNIEPDSRGNFTLDAGGCYKLERTIQLGGTVGGIQTASLTSSNTIRLRNNCGPCCECSDYVSVYEALRKLNTRYRYIQEDAVDIRDQLRENRARWEQQRDCRSRQSARLTLVPLVGNRIAVGAVFCNNTGECLHDVELRVTFDMSNEDLLDLIGEDLDNFPFYITELTGETSENLTMCAPESEAVGCVVPGSSYRMGNIASEGNDNTGCGGTNTSFTSYSSPREAYAPGGTWPTYTAVFARVNPGASAALTTVIGFQEGDAGARVEAALLVFQDLNDDGSYEKMLAGPVLASTNILPDVDDEECY